MWVKFFADGSKEEGSDEAIRAGTASWSKGRFDDITSVKLHQSDIQARLSVHDTRWHQFDRLQVVVQEGEQKPELLYRAVQAEIQLRHEGLTLMHVSYANQLFSWFLDDCAMYTGTMIRPVKLITSKEVGKWVTIILPGAGYPHSTFSVKGRINDDKHLPRQHT